MNIVSSVHLLHNHSLLIQLLSTKTNRPTQNAFQEKAHLLTLSQRRRPHIHRPLRGPLPPHLRDRRSHQKCLPQSRAQAPPRYIYPSAPPIKPPLPTQLTLPLQQTNAPPKPAPLQPRPSSASPSPTPSSATPAAAPATTPPAPPLRSSTTPARTLTGSPSTAHSTAKS